MFLYHSLLILAFLLTCYSEVSAKSLDDEKPTLEVDDDNDFLARSIPFQKQNIKQILQQGLDASEPLHHDFIDGDLGTLKYTVNNSYITGVNLCKIISTEVDKEVTTLKVSINCPRLKFTGLYTVSGVLIAMPLEGDGDYSIKAKDYSVTVTTAFKKFKGKDDKIHLKFKNYSLQARAYGKVSYQLNNLYHGNEKLSDAVHKFANDNWKTVAEFAQDPVWYPSVKKILKNTNQYLKPIPLDEIEFD